MWSKKPAQGGGSPVVACGGSLVGPVTPVSGKGGAVSYIGRG